MLNIFQKKQLEEPVKNYSQVISSAVSPYYSKSQLRPYNPDELYQKRGNLDLFDEMLQDDQIYSALNLKKIIILGSGYDINCDDENIKEFIEYNLGHCIDDVFNKKIYEILTALGYGYSITEKVFDLKDTDYGEKIVLTHLKTRAPHAFELHTDDKGELTKLVQNTEKGAVELEPNKFIIYSYNKEFDNPYGKSDLNKGVYRAWSAKDAVIRFWNIYLEKHVNPLLVGKLPRGVGEGEKNLFIKILKNITAKTVVTMPNDFELSKIDSANASGEFEKAINKYNTIIARTLFVPDLLGYSGSETGGGSYALGKEQFDIFYLGIEYIRKDIESLINKHIVKPLVAWNFGEYECEFKFKSLTETQKVENMKLWLDAAKSGKIPVTYQHVNWFLSNIKSPEITEDEYTEIQEQKQEVAEQIRGQQPDNMAEKKEEKSKPESKDEKLKDEKKEIEKKFELEFNRELTQYERKVDFAKITKDTGEIEDKYKIELAGLFKTSINGLIDEIKRRKIIENKKLEFVNKLYLKNISLIKNKMKEMMSESYKKGKTSINFEIINPSSGISDEDIAVWIRENAVYAAGMEGENILKIVKDTLFESIRNGYGVDTTVRALERALSGFDIEMGASTLERLVRTNTLRAYNQARADDFAQMGNIKAFMFSAIMDGRTSDICFELDKKVFPPADMMYYNPPLHPNCRSVLVPIFEDEEFSGYDDMPATEQVSSGFLQLKKDEFNLN